MGAIGVAAEAAQNARAKKKRPEAHFFYCRLALAADATKATL
jgi:hypothetical protein